jgi:hypothetical protein
MTWHCLYSTQFGMFSNVRVWDMSASETVQTVFHRELYSLPHYLNWGSCLWLLDVFKWGYKLRHTQINSSWTHTQTTVHVHSTITHDPSLHVLCMALLLLINFILSIVFMIELEKFSWNIQFYECVFIKKNIVTSITLTYHHQQSIGLFCNHKNAFHQYSISWIRTELASRHCSELNESRLQY